MNGKKKKVVLAQVSARVLIESFALAACAGTTAPRAGSGSQSLSVGLSHANCSGGSSDDDAGCDDGDDGGGGNDGGGSGESGGGGVEPLPLISGSTSISLGDSVL